MPYKSGFPPLPFLDPINDPDHPAHGIKLPPEDPFLPWTKAEKRRMIQELTEQAIANYEPKHVVRSYEADATRRETHDFIMRLRLIPKDEIGEPVDRPLPRNVVRFTTAIHEIQSPWTNDGDLDRTDFRQFAVQRLRLSYRRFHLSTDESEPELTRSPVDTPEPEVCWIMEYTENECNTIRRQLAHALGLYPAATDETISAYDEEIAWRYERRLKSRCRRRHTRCIRPSHIELFTQCGRILP